MWIARDKNNSLWLYVSKPVKEQHMFTTGTDDDSGMENINKNFFPEVTWDNSPIQIELKFIINNK